MLLLGFFGFSSNSLIELSSFKIIRPKRLASSRVTSSTVIRYHANIRKALEDAYRNDLIPCNYADKAHRPKKTEHVSKYYTVSELLKLFELVKGTKIEFPVLMAGYYGLRREEIVGLKWENVNFEEKTITICHTITEYCLNGKMQIQAKDRCKTKKSIRTLPLLAEIEKLLLEIKDKIFTCYLFYFVFHFHLH